MMMDDELDSPELNLARPLLALSGHHDGSAECRIAGNSGHRDCKQPFPRITVDEFRQIRCLDQSPGCMKKPRAMPGL
jgi:hypothetical protein